ncbi:hypothetical protein KR093_007301 [Drosophila rubida]|uniref:Uncharacterized protein n=1 Tax=Drosophila rubida TaxID=30044 RepID=A0AAD4JWG6_9MUSC|nr:hypothetical protein KR093_007301 [Drosophila rubida]
MSDKRPLLDPSDNETECGGGGDVREFLKPSGITYKSTAGAPTVFWYGTQILLRRKVFIGVLVLFIFSYFVIGPADVLDLDNTNSIIQVHHQSNVLDMEVAFVPEANQTIILPKGYLVYSNQCRIVDLDPYKREMMRHFKRVPYRRCKKLLPLTQVRYDDTTQRYVLSINSTAFTMYVVESSLSCCYMGVKRMNDKNVTMTHCKHFKTKASLPNTTDSVIVKCATDRGEIYANGHATIPERQEVRQHLDQWRQRDRGRRVPSVLMIGIDSISRVNLIRAMPKTAQYLYDNDWFELAGYNKIDDNTFPNIMALMTGYNLSNALKHCNPYVTGGLDKCDFLWKRYKQHGYVTAYGEDAVAINTFNYLKKGFKQSPVDYYMRPYLAAAEKLLDVNVEMGLIRCLGYATASEHVYNYALEFARRFRNESFFGFFWTNTHSHSDISQTSSMDDYLRNYLQRLVAQGTMEHSIVVFFSDHGLRFGPTRATWSGHLEERLPFLFIWLPPFIRSQHPEFVEALRLNRNRLTTPYDLHLTLKHILTLSGRTNGLETGLDTAKDCAQCQSLLLPVPLNRSCEDVAIADHWCTCWGYDAVYKNYTTMLHLGERVVHYLNDYVKNFRNGSLAHLCQPLVLQGINSAYKARIVEADFGGSQVYWMTFYTGPNQALYETTVRYNKHLPKEESVLVTGSVSRLNSYSGEADCMNDFAIKKYCFCRHRSG